jgi:hypothetical protein
MTLAVACAALTLPRSRLKDPLLASPYPGEGRANIFCVRYRSDLSVATRLLVVTVMMAMAAGVSAMVAFGSWRACRA